MVNEQNPLLQEQLKQTADNHLSYLDSGDLVVLILNLHAGTFAVSNAIANIIDELTKLDIVLEVYQTKKVGDGAILAAKHGLRAKLIVCAGGDGTLNEVCNGLMSLKHAPPLAYIPAGTTCDFARTLRLPIEDYKAAASIAGHGQPVPLDIGKMNHRYFAYVASFGAFTHVASSTPRKMKMNWGHLAYVIEGLKSLPSIKPIRVKIELDDAVIEEDLLFGSVSNTTSIGGLLRIDESQVLMDDGKFEIMLIKNPSNPLETPLLLSSLLNQDYQDKNLIFFSTSKLKLHFPDPVSWTLDGEDVGFHSLVEIENKKQALRIMLPQDE